MKKTLLVAIVSVILFASCKKETPSIQQVDTSENPIYISISTSKNTSEVVRVY